eukprot:773066-Prorocentrum_minimum.AAC.1
MNECMHTKYRLRMNECIPNTDFVYGFAPFREPGQELPQLHGGHGGPRRVPVLVRTRTALSLLLAGNTG